MDGDNSVWEQLKLKYAQKGVIKFIQVDCEANPEKAREFEVVGFPTICKVIGSTITRFAGNRTVEELDQFILPCFKPPTR
jgi:thioredoxin-like negative regulator of GroEL